jgi:RNA polymerase sigma factor (sigma-70 family)
LFTMSTSTLGLFLRHLALSEEVSRLGTTSDYNLLAAYESGHGQAAFTELMRRYGPMVLRTCRRVLGHGPDAEDAFQATFVLLARKAGELRSETARPLSLGGWLHHVAYQTALKVLTGEIRRRAHERQAGAMMHPDPDPLLEATWNEVRPILDAELDRLPDGARRLLIACYLQGKTHAEAAAELKLPQGSIARHLERARTLLATRLARRGITVSTILLAVLLEDLAHGAGVPAVLLVHTLEAATICSEQWCGLVSTNVAQLVKGGLMQMAKGWTHLSMALAGWAALLGIGLIACQTLKAWPDQTPQGEPAAATARPIGEADKPRRSDCFGDPLPPRALARMGTVRLFNNETNQVSPSKLLAFSPDGKVLASHIDGMKIALWDAATGKEIGRLTLDPGKGKEYLFSLGFAPDGKTLVTVSWDQRVSLWDAATGKLLRTVSYKGPARRNLHPGKVAFLPDGRMLAAVDFQKSVENEEGIRGTSVWDMATGKEVRPLSDPKKRRAARFNITSFSRDGKLLAAGTHDEDGTSLWLWDVATGKEIHQLTENKDSGKVLGIRALAYSHDGKMLATADLETIPYGT